MFLNSTAAQKEEIISCIICFVPFGSFSLLQNSQNIVTIVFYNFEKIKILRIKYIFSKLESSKIEAYFTMLPVV